MDALKSREQLLLLLVTNVLCDIADASPSIQKTIARDIKTLEARFAHEGFQFLTIALPRLGKALEFALETGALQRIEGFRTLRHSAAIPAFLSGMWLQVFTMQGILRPDASPEAIRHLRQVAYLVYKYEIPFSERVLNEFQQKFIETDQAIPDDVPDGIDRVLRFNVRRVLFGIFEGFNPRNIRPKHGPGAVSTGEKLEGKWCFKRLYDSLHQCYPYYEYFVTGVSELCDRIKWYKQLERVPSGTTKVVFVPKDSRGPRVISSEPLEYMFAQQGLATEIVDLLEKGSSLTRGRVNFTSQLINRRLASLSSETGAYATIDLSEASDRVPKWVTDFFPKELARFMNGTRSTHTVLPNGERIELKKFAPMGSAMCFPVESVFFYAVSVAAVIGLAPLTRETVKRADCFVYGDDIIVPVEHYESVCAALELFGLKINHQKSFRKGQFRESCGMDAYRGIDVTPIKIRTPWSGRPSDAKSLLSWVEYSNSLRVRYPKTADVIRRMIEQTYGRIPFGLSTSPFPCLQVQSAFEAEAANVASGFKWRWNEGLQRMEFRVKTARLRTRDSLLQGWNRLMCDLLTHHSASSEVVVPRSTLIRPRWCTV
jgi:hypothetical protein